MAKKHLGSITILVKNRQNNAKIIQTILSENSEIIIARLGVNIQKSCIKNCTGLLNILVEGEAREINKLGKKLDGLYGIAAKAIIIT